MTKFLDPSRIKRFFFLGLGEDCRTPPPSSRLLDHGCTWNLRGRHPYSLALPVTKQVGRGPSLSRDRASIVARADFHHRVDNLRQEKIICAACRRLEKREEGKVNHVFPFFPTAAVGGSFRLFFDRKCFLKYFLSASHFQFCKSNPKFSTCEGNLGSLLATSRSVRNELWKWIRTPC